MTRQFRRTVAIALLVLTLVAFSSSIFFTTIWETYVHYVLLSILRPIGIEKLPLPLGLAIAFFIIFVPVIAVGGLIGAAFRPFIRLSPSEVYENQSRRLSEAQRALKDSLAYFETLSKDVTGKFKELESVAQELETMKALHEEDAAALKEKIAFVNKRPRWLVVLTHTTAFIAGIFGNLIASYIYDYMK